LLLEPQRTNVALFSEQFTNAVWINQTSNTTITKVASSTAPDGYSFTRLVTTGSGGQGRLVQLLSGSETSLTYSIYVRGTGTTQLNLFMSGGGNFTGPVVTLTNNWQRISISGTRASGSTGDFEIRVFGGNTLEVYGAQVEAGAYATSYIPTLGTSVTRVADACRNTSASSLIGQTEGTIFGEMYTNPAGTESLLTFTRNGSAGLYGTYIYLGTVSTAAARVEIQQVGVGGFEIVGSPLSVGWHKFAFAYKANDFAFYVDGVQVGTSSSGIFPTGMNELYIDQYIDGGIRNAPKKQVLLFPTRLSNSDLAALTA
jgi:hypothetical protein